MEDIVFLATVGLNDQIDFIKCLLVVFPSRLLKEGHVLSHKLMNYGG